MLNQSERDEIKKIIGRNIARYREKMMTQEELGYLAKVNEKHISKIETGQKLPSCVTIKNISTVLGVNSDDLMEGINDITKVEPYKKK